MREYRSGTDGQLAVAETNTINSSGEAITTGFTFPFDTNSHGVVVAVSLRIRGFVR
jgi:hypothetical protein